MSDIFYQAVSFCLSFFRGIPGRQLNSGSLENVVQKELYGFQMFALRPDPDRAPFRIQMISGHEDTVADIDSDRNRICAVFLVVRDGVFAAAVILPPDYVNAALNDSKQLSERQRYELRPVIERDALAWAVGVVSPEEIDRINILNASILAMHRALDQLQPVPEAVIVDGNRFKPWNPSVPYTCIVKGDAKYLSIAAASVLAKTCRDDYMMRLADEYPQYDWQHNKGYPTRRHREAIRQHGTTPYHRMTYNLLGTAELSLDFKD